MMNSQPSDPVHTHEASRLRDEQASPSLSDASNFINRDLSWLSFNRRVLDLAMDPDVPLLERVRFLMISASNLDEFFMKRMALLRRRLSSNLDLRSSDGMTVRERIERCREAVDAMFRVQAECWSKQLLPALANEGIRIERYADLPEHERRALDIWYDTNVFPIMTPLAVDPGHRFPFISNLSENLGVLLVDPQTEEQSFARLKIPDVLPRLVQLQDGGDHPRGVRLVPLDQIIEANLQDVFPGMQIIAVLPFRVTRSVVVEQDDDDIEDLLEHVEAELQLRRFAEPVRLEVDQSPSAPILELLMEELQLNAEALYAHGGLLEYADLQAVVDLDRPELKHPVWRPVVPERLRDAEKDIFAVIRERDVFVHHPYDSFSASVERFIAAAAHDPNVLAIKQTLYRTSRESPFVEHLIHAAQEGKQVACLVELRARFDEDKNVRFARQLEKHGVHVAYGLVGLKTHCKASLVVRREGDGLRCYTHLGTGNYHPGTAQLYTDCGLLTCDPDITNDVVNLFNHLTGRSRNRDYRQVLVAPDTMRDRFIELIGREIQVARAGGRGRIIAKMNAIEDEAVIVKLYEASCAGVEVDLIVRGFCTLRPGVPGVSERIRVRSIVGRFLEHSRIFFFGNGAEDPLDGVWYIGSGDWMSRNLGMRVESAAPVQDRAARTRLQRILDVCLRDRQRAWLLKRDGAYFKPTPPDDAETGSPEALGTFLALCADAQARA
ncbi:MAG: polyphosphate kinase 1 [Phycisphaerales bacterium]|nr:polyphosphate kinase 1 [Phycisphaerales bacterium]